ncbi:c-type cytochrome [Enterovirga sp. CN4-39]|uniref:c-type cytochrome n=1 Tax=Enterovirga sp. CN4-39 TaxID=3400910 RepID=UPI003BFF554B
MFSIKGATLVAGIAAASAVPVQAEEFGRPATPADIAAWDIAVKPDGAGLPPGRGTVVMGREVFENNCAACHGPTGGGGLGDRLVGGQRTLATATPVKTVGSFWPYATTLFDYVRRAMPYQAPGTLSNDETYAVVAYTLSLNGILPPSGALDRNSLPKVQMPNRDGFVADPHFDPATLFKGK